MNDTYILPHLGLGDHIVCNGLVRELSKQFDKMIMFVKEENFVSVSSMFKDLNMGYFVGKNDSEIFGFISSKKPEPLFKIGHEKLDLKKCFDRSFYEECGVDFETRWTSWHIPRDKEREEALFKHFGVKEGEYAFLHEDNRFRVKPELLPKDITIIKPNKDITPNIFDYLTILERAKEIHCIASSFLFIIDSIETCDNIHLHTYMRTYPSWCVPTLKRNWTIY